MKTLFMLLTLLTAGSAGAVEYHAGFVGRQFTAAEMNDALDSVGLKQIKQVPGVTLEVDAEPISRIHFGLRLEDYHLHVGDGKSQTFAADPGFSEFNAVMAMGIMRWSLVDGAPFRVDLIGGAGGVSASMNFKADNSVEYKEGTRGLDMRGIEMAGLAINIGSASSFCVTFEGGYQWANVNALSHDEGATPVVNKLDINGPFAGIGVMFTPGATPGGSSHSSK